MRKTLSLLVAASLWFMTLVAAPAVQADDTRCLGTAPPLVVGNLIVPPITSAGVCALNGNRITGNLIVMPGGHLNARSIDVGGNVWANQHDAVFIDFGSEIAGDVQANNGVRVSTAISSSIVGGDIELTGNDTEFVGSSGNRVGGDIQVWKNTADRYHLLGNNVTTGDVQFFENTGTAQINGNTIAGNLQCEENAPPPAAAGNVVGGNSEGQCAAP